ncbi:MAG: hypothetical protein ACRDN0_34560 [Trebonia sp.]
MAGSDFSRPGSRVWNGGDGADGDSEDVLEQDGGRRFPALGIPALSWRPSRGAAILAAIALLAGLAVGFTAGRSQAVRANPVAARGAGTLKRGAETSAPATSPSATSPSVTVSPALVQDVGACSAQAGQDLQLGVQVTNQSGQPVTLNRVKSLLPLGGLKPIAQQWAPCGTLPATSALLGDGLLGQVDPGNQLAPGASTWFTFTFRVLRTCPSPLPVQFTIEYEMDGHPGQASLPGFPDLSEVPYTGCGSH